MSLTKLKLFIISNLPLESVIYFSLMFAEIIYAFATTNAYVVLLFVFEVIVWFIANHFLIVKLKNPKNPNKQELRYFQIEKALFQKNHYWISQSSLPFLNKGLCPGNTILSDCKKLNFLSKNIRMPFFILTLIKHSLMD